MEDRYCSQEAGKTASRARAPAPRPRGAPEPQPGEVFCSVRARLPRFGWDTAMGLWGTGVELAAGWRLRGFRG